MKLLWQVTDADVAVIKQFVSQQQSNALVRVRIERNCAPEKSQVTREAFWQQMVCMRLTTQQKSGPHDPVGRFAKAKPFRLPYDMVRKSRDAQSQIQRTLKAWGGIRMVPKIAAELSRNLVLLESGEWGRALEQCNRLTRNVSVKVEREIADYIRNTLLGFGPKQSRNLLQALYLTRFEIPIDSRLISWLNEFGFPVRLHATGLSDIHYYNFVSDGVQELCAKSSVLPCVLDAAIFSLKEGDAWTAENAY